MSDHETQAEKTPAHAAAKVPGWRSPHHLENQIPALIAVVAAAVLQFVLPAGVQLIHPPWLMAVLELVLLVVLVVFEVLPGDVNLRVLTVVLVVLVALDNTVSSALLAVRMVEGYPSMTASRLVMMGGSIWITNVISYGILYWLMDRGGPHARARAEQAHPDFLFPQMQAPDLAPSDWRPLFLDYLYVSLTNATAFSPTDTMPMTIRAKCLMSAQSIVALAIVALVLARAVNILGQ